AFEVRREVRRWQRHIASNSRRREPPGSSRGRSVRDNDDVAASTAYRHEQRQDGRKDDLHNCSPQRSSWRLESPVQKGTGTSSRYWRATGLRTDEGVVAATGPNTVPCFLSHWYSAGGRFPSRGEGSTTDRAHNRRTTACRKRRRVSVRLSTGAQGGVARLVVRDKQPQSKPR